MRITFRKFLKKDLKLCCKIILETLGDKNAKEAELDFLEGLNKEKETYDYINRFVAVYKNEIVGVGGLYNLITHPKGYAGVCWFAVKKKYSKKGIGTKILLFTENKAKQQGYKNFFVWSTEEASPFYKKFGFKKSRLKLRPKESNLLLVKKI